MNKKLLCLLMFVFSLSLFTACSSDDDPENLMLEKNEVVVIEGATETVKITKGNGGYQLEANDGAIAKAVLSGNEIKVTGVSGGEVTIVVTDKEGKKASLKVKVGKADYASLIKGTYQGELAIALGEEPIKMPKDIEIERDDEDIITVALREFSLGEISLGDIIVDDIPVTKGVDGVLVLTETMKKMPIEALGGMEVDVTITGEVKDKTLDLTIAVNVPELGDINVTFTGDKK